MPQNLTPSPSYGTYPVTNIPIDGEAATADSFKGVYQDIYNRIAYTKNAIDTNLTSIASLGSADTQLSADIAANTALIQTNDQKFVNVESKVGSGVTAAGAHTYSSTNKIVNSDTHHSAIGKLDASIGSIEAAQTILNINVPKNTQDITSIAGKVSATAKNGIVGLLLGALDYCDDNDTVEDALLKIGHALEGKDRTANHAYEMAAKNWMIGKSATGSIFDTLTSKKWNTLSSTPNCHNPVNQTFGSDSSAWEYYTEINTIPTGVTKVMIQFNSLGTLTVQANLAGSFTTGFTSIGSEDTWVTLTTGTQLVLKVSGNSGSYLYNYTLLYGS